MPIQSLRNASTVLLLGTFLAACQTTQTPPPRIDYPAPLFECLDAPDASTVTNDTKLAIYIAELAGAHEDCKTRLKTLQEVVNQKSG